MPTAKKIATGSADNSGSPLPHTSTRPKPRPTYKGSTKDSKPPRAEASDAIAQTSKKAVNHRQSVTSAESASDASMDGDAGEDEVTEMEEEDDGNWDEEDEEDEDDEPEVKGHQQKETARSAPGM